MLLVLIFGLLFSSCSLFNPSFSASVFMGACRASVPVPLITCSSPFVLAFPLPAALLPRRAQWLTQDLTGGFLSKALPPLSASRPSPAPPSLLLSCLISFLTTHQVLLVDLLILFLSVCPPFTATDAQAQSRCSVILCWCLQALKREKVF